MRLMRCTGPECPRCGCRDSDVLSSPATPPDEGEDLPYIAPAGGSFSEWARRVWWGSGRAICLHCHTRFTFDESDIDAATSPIAPTVCPACDGSRYWVYTTRGKIQYRKCRDCGHHGEKKTTK